MFNINAESKPVRGKLLPIEIGVADGSCAYFEYFRKEKGLLKHGVLQTTKRSIGISSCRRVAETPISVGLICLWVSVW